jgi:hypothetical protein
MQGILSVKPNLNELYRLIDKVPKFPVSKLQLVNLAKRRHAPKEVIDFYSSFGTDYVFETKDDLTARTEQVDLMRQEEAKMPREEEVAAEDY